MLDKNDFMKKIILFLFFPLFLFPQEATLIGDVDCNGELNSEDASLILQYVTSVIDSLPCQENMSGLTPDQLQEIIDMITEANDAISSINMIGPMYTYEEYSDLFDLDYVYAATCCNEMYYFEALLFCAKLEYEGYDDWRIPSLEEIQNWILANNSHNLLIPNYTTGSAGSFFVNMAKGSYSERVAQVYLSNNGTVLWYHNTENAVQNNKCFCVR